MKKDDIIKVLEILKKFYGEKNFIELKYKNEFTLLVAIILSAQSTDKGVNKATKELFETVDTPEKMLKLGEENLKTYIKTIGLYNSKAKNIIKLSEILVKEHKSKIPSDFSVLTSLPGVGRKTANVFLNTVYDLPCIAVDTHVFRVVNRIGIVKTKNPTETEFELEKVIPQEYKKYINSWFVIFGRYLCKAKNPDCATCQLKTFCKFYKEQNK